MGNTTSSTAISEIINNSINNVMLNIQSNTGSSTTQSQNITVGEGASNVTISGNTMLQSILISMTSTQDTSAITDMQNSLTKEIAAQLSVKKSDFGIMDKTEASVKDIVKNSITNNISQSFVTNCIGSAAQSQGIDIKAGASNINITGNQLTQTAELAIKCMQSSEAVSNVKNEIMSKLDIKADVVVESWFSNLLSGFAAYWYIFIIIGVIVFIMFMSGGKDKVIMLLKYVGIPAAIIGGVYFMYSKATSGNKA
jgi:hypothetical protein